MHRPALEPVERGGDGGGETVDEALGCEDGRGLEGDGGDRGVLPEIAAERICSLRRLIGKEGGEQRIA